MLNETLKDKQDVAVVFFYDLLTSYDRITYHTRAERLYLSLSNNINHIVKKGVRQASTAAASIVSQPVAISCY